MLDAFHPVLHPGGKVRALAFRSARLNGLHLTTTWMFLPFSSFFFKELGWDAMTVEPKPAGLAETQTQ